MTQREKIIVSAYTGYLMCDFNDVHKYIEEKFGRPVFTHEMASYSVKNEIKEQVKPDFMALCGNDSVRIEMCDFCENNEFYQSVNGWEGMRINFCPLKGRH